MAQITINFAEVEDTAFEPIPDGEYPVTIDHVELRDSKSSDNPYLNWEMVISEGEYANRKLWMMTSLSEKALWRLKAVFSNLGVLEEEMLIEVDEDTKFVTTPELTGLPATAIVHTEVYEGKTRNRVEDLVALETMPKKSALKVKASAPAKASVKAPTKPAPKPVAGKKPALKLK